MTRHCFYADWLDAAERLAVLKDQAAHHVRNVLRLKPGEVIDLRDCDGRGWKGVIADMTEEQVRIQLLEPYDLPTESPLELSLALALARPDRMDLVLRQATEIGLTRFIVFKAERSQYGLSRDQAAKRRDRWLKIAREAVCQCGRMRLPEIVICEDWMDFLLEASQCTTPRTAGLRIFADESGTGRNLLSLWRSCPMYRQVLTVVGPEGGWTPVEVNRFAEADFYPVRLGPRILRFETAATALLSSVQTLWGDFGQPV